jgi:hypothetical protein
MTPPCDVEGALLFHYVKVNLSLRIPLTQAHRHLPTRPARRRVRHPSVTRLALPMDRRPIRRVPVDAVRRNRRRSQSPPALVVIERYAVNAVLTTPSVRLRADEREVVRGRARPARASLHLGWPTQGGRGDASSTCQHAPSWPGDAHHRVDALTVAGGVQHTVVIGASRTDPSPQRSRQHGMTTARQRSNMKST